MNFGVAGGWQWRFVSPVISLRPDREYTVQAIISQGMQELWVDGVRMSQSTVAYMPDTRDLTANDLPDWAGAPAGYLIVQASLAASSSGGASVNLALVNDAGAPGASSGHFRQPRHGASAHRSPGRSPRG
jgi:hypothetical protein